MRTPTGDYHLQLTSAVVSQDNFAHMIVGTEQIQVDYYDPNGKVLQSAHIPLHNNLS
ncbi:hypothetical protein D3C73_1502130 [compost metagenome]